MTQIDLDDLPPRVSQALTSLAAEEVVVLVQGGRVVARLRAEVAAPAASSEPEPEPEAAMKEVMEQFSAMIHDEF